MILNLLLQLWNAQVRKNWLNCKDTYKISLRLCKSWYWEVLHLLCFCRINSLWRRYPDSLKPGWSDQVKMYQATFLQEHIVPSNHSCDVIQPMQIHNIRSNFLGTTRKSFISTLGSMWATPSKFSSIWCPQTFTDNNFRNTLHKEYKTDISSKSDSGHFHKKYVWTFLHARLLLSLNKFVFVKPCLVLFIYFCDKSIPFCLFHLFFLSISDLLSHFLST